MQKHVVLPSYHTTTAQISVLSQSLRFGGDWVSFQIAKLHHRFQGQVIRAGHGCGLALGFPSACSVPASVQYPVAETPQFTVLKRVFAAVGQAVPSSRHRLPGHTQSPFDRGLGYAPSSFAPLRRRFSNALKSRLCFITIP